jgi:hypothetical protein
MRHAHTHMCPPVPASVAGLYNRALVSSWLHGTLLQGLYPPTTIDLAYVPSLLDVTANDGSVVGIQELVLGRSWRLNETANCTQGGQPTLCSLPLPQFVPANARCARRVAMLQGQR